MKKILSLLLSALLAIFFVTCNSDDISNEDFPDNPETEEDFDVFIERLETEIFNVSDAVNALIDKYGSVDGMLNHIDEVAAVDGVSEIDTTEYKLILKTNEGFRISWERFPLGSLKSETAEVNELNKLMAKSASSKNKENEHIFKDIREWAKKICIVNQTSNDDLFKEENELYEKLYLDLKNSGYNVDYIDANKLTCEWIKNSMEDYNFILFNTHGGFVDNLHWFATGEISVDGTIKDICTFFKKFDGLFTKFSVEFLNEKHGNSEVRVPYIHVSEKVFTGDYKDDILFFTSCHTLEGNSKDLPNTAVADVFINKGATAFLGYNNTNTVGPKAGPDFLRNMMLGYTVEEAFNKLDSCLKHEEKVDFKPDNMDKIYNYDTYLYLLPTDGKHKNVCIVHPKVTTGDADNITPNKATLSMIVEGVNQLDTNMHIAILKDKDKKKVENPDSNSIKYVIKNINYSTFSYEQNFSDLEENTTYYYRAFLKWGEHEYSGEIKEFTTKVEDEPIRPYLVKLYESTNGKEWNNTTNWCSDKPVHEWYGVWRDYENPGFYKLDLANNNLNGPIDLSDCPYISQVIFSNNSIHSLNLQNCENLVKVTINSFPEDKYLKSIDFSNCDKLKEFVAVYSFPNLEEVYANNCIELKSFKHCNGNLKIIDFSGCTNLKFVNVDDNKLKQLILSDCSSLETLHCINNELDKLDLSDSKKLILVSCFNNHIKSLITQDIINLVNINNCNFHCDWLYKYNRFLYQSTQEDAIKEGWIRINDEDCDFYMKNEYGWYFEGEPNKNRNNESNIWKKMGGVSK